VPNRTKHYASRNHTDDSNRESSRLSVFWDWVKHITERVDRTMFWARLAAIAEESITAGVVLEEES